MLVLNMEPKRQRRPNVRLGEIGDVSAAFAYGVSQKSKKGFWGKRWEYSFIYPEESEYNHNSGIFHQRSSEFTHSDSALSPMLSVDMQQNSENKNPNNMKLIPECATLDEINMMKSKVDFGTVSQKCRFVKKGRRSKRCKRTAFGGFWNPNVSTGVGEKNGGREVIGFASNHCPKACAVYGFGDTHPPDNENSLMSREVCENNIYDPTFQLQTRGNSNEILKEGAVLDCNNLWSESFSREDYLEVCHIDTNNVARWLEELGLSRYADAFEMHEVDDDALPLLTVDDLKEMGVLAVGPRRKLYTAIRQLRDSKGSVSC